ncbi:MAG: hypothetical protein ACLQLG_03825 [Thermoguttaceae bacterium]
MRKVLGIGAVVFALALSLAVLPGDANAFFGRWRCCGCGYGCGCNSCYSGCSTCGFSTCGCNTCGFSSCGCNTAFVTPTVTYSAAYWPTTTCCGGTIISQGTNLNPTGTGLNSGTVNNAPPAPMAAPSLPAGSK